MRLAASSAPDTPCMSRTTVAAPELVRLNVLQFAQDRGGLDEMKALVDSCMADYDLGGWTEGPWT